MATPSRSTLLPSPVSFEGTLSEVARGYMEAVSAELEEGHWAGAGGIDTCVRLATSVDNLIRFIFEAANERYSRRYTRAHQRCAVIAQGSYGRRELSPQSDLDILVIYPTTVTAYVETIAESLLYSLWDAGLQVGHAVRTIPECVELAKKDLTIKTAILDGRFICGSTELGADFSERVQAEVARTDTDGFIAAKLRESADRHSRYGGSVFMLEPNVKEGQGGLRDLHTVLWAAHVKRGILKLEQLAEAQIVSEEELAELLAANEFITRVRNSLHFLTHSKQDSLTFDRQEAIAARFGYQSDDRNTAADLFMRDYYRHAAVVARTSADIIERLSDASVRPGFIDRLVSRAVRDGVSIVGERLAAEERIFREDPVNLLRVLHDAQRNDVTLSSETREAVRSSARLITPEIAASKEAIGAFFDILRWKDGVYRTLAEMNRLGVLGHLVPEFGRLFCMVQHDFYHVYTVDEHSLVGVRELEFLRDGVFVQQSPLLTQIMRECDRAEILYLAMMFHDLGKGYGGDHDERGALMVRDIGKRLGLHKDDRETLEFLVRHHLVMSMLAQSRDVEDDMLVANFVKQVGNPTNLRYLYLLTFADMKAVGPKVWSGWKDHLLSELYMRSVDMFDKGLVTEADLRRRAKRIKLRVAKRATADAERARIETFLDKMPNSYLLSTGDDAIYDHWRLYESLGRSLFRSGVEHHADRGFSEFTVCTADRPGIFLRIAGVLLAHGLSVIGARITTSAEKIVLDTFRIDHATGTANPLDPEVWTHVRRSLEGVLDGSIDVDILVADARRASERTIVAQKARRRVRTRVEIDNEVSKKYTVLDLYASDRAGLLFTVASCIYHLGLRIHVAKITTHVDKVLDVFYVTDVQGRKVTAPERLEEIREIIVETLDEPDSDEADAPKPAVVTH